MIAKRQVGRLAERYRAKLPTQFFEDLDFVRAEMALGRWPDLRRTKGRHSGWWPKLRAAILLELHALLCSDDPRYKNDRARGAKVGAAAMWAVTGYICGAVGRDKGDEAIAGAVATIALSVAAVGKNAFCRLPIPMLANDKSTTARPEKQKGVRTERKKSSPSTKAGGTGRTQERP
jgi:hypothetical protein